MSRADISLPPSVTKGGPISLSAASLPAVPSGRWHPGQADEGVMHSEFFAPGREASGAGCALAMALDELHSRETDPLAEAEDRRSVLWVQDRASLRLTGRPYRPGLPQSLRHRLIHVVADKAEDALFALEEGLRCHDLAFVLGELAGNPKALDFTASRRLTLAAEKHGVPLWLVRVDAARELSSARMRWEVRHAPSRPPCWNAQAPGRPSWRAELFRSRSHRPGKWILHDDGHSLAAPAAPHFVGMAFAAGDRSLAAV